MSRHLSVEGCHKFTGGLSQKIPMESIVGIPLGEFNEVLNLTVGRWWKLLERHSNFLDQSVRERILIALLDLGRKFGARDDRGMIIDLRLTAQDIADLVDSSRPKTSECLKKLVAEGVVMREHGRFVSIPRKFRLAYDPDAPLSTKEAMRAIFYVVSCLLHFSSRSLGPRIACLLDN